LAAVEEEVAAAQAEDDGAVDAGGPHERPVEDLAQVLEERVAAVLGRLDDPLVDVGPEGEAVRAADATLQQHLDGTRDVARARGSTSGSTRRRIGATPSTTVVPIVSVRPRLVAECCQPCGPEKSTSLRAASEATSCRRASSSSSPQPLSVMGAMSRRRWFIA